uniref:Uncharacterized protein n=1 Tax=Tetraselmis sp. GSL018 TaxID=582737 RepID=A0A061R413_9CHLO|mmetsp:Transcript_24372/g.58087  ORF Transcript_24372/g.58087 Transcript_24372/m.58087 type:complete len:372 (+) Transcript_24372:160-1275(+)|eukprot:CAMPEP_0177604918 /NCGR_PEP_ID=MMETSP0419_2-20121207/16393_1 /TAXON_ID=582737 /ORGANISM="Tetraselmis sp., Strain GSL018" /LENGTH=371 /DNA_ID=CAMNT_0019098971 /DNA_START=104 /DNA_END=1219 /DNA_ORIENTATION=+
MTFAKRVILLTIPLFFLDARSQQCTNPEWFKGYWERNPLQINRSVTRDSLWDPNRRWKWRLHSESRSCKVDDLVTQAILSGSDTPDWFPSTIQGQKHFHIVFVGDSLERNTVRFFCEIAASHGFHGSFLPSPPPKKTKKKKKKKKRQPVIQPKPSQNTTGTSTFAQCTNKLFTLSWFQIFSLSETLIPRGTQVVAKSDPRVKRNEAAAHTLFRLEHFLPEDVVGFDEAEAIVIASNLWDLTRPVADTDYVTQEQILSYKGAVSNVTTLLRNAHPKKKLVWMTKPYVSTNDGVRRSGKELLTRTRRSQAALNSALCAAVLEKNDKETEVFDWCSMLVGFSHLAADGRHYPPPPSLAMLNLLLNVLRHKFLQG